MNFTQNFTQIFCPDYAIPGLPSGSTKIWITEIDGETILRVPLYGGKTILSPLFFPKITGSETLLPLAVMVNGKPVWCSETSAVYFTGEAWIYSPGAILPGETPSETTEYYTLTMPADFSSAASFDLDPQPAGTAADQISLQITWESLQITSGDLTPTGSANLYTGDVMTWH